MPFNGAEEEEDNCYYWFEITVIQLGIHCRDRRSCNGSVNEMPGAIFRQRKYIYLASLKRASGILEIVGVRIYGVTIPPKGRASR